MQMITMQLIMVIFGDFVMIAYNDDNANKTM